MNYNRLSKKCIDLIQTNTTVNHVYFNMNNLRSINESEKK